MSLNSLGLDKSPTATKVCVAMSGGVDSTATAIMLKNQGYNVFGLTMDLLDAPYRPEVLSIADAGIAAAQIGIEHHYLDLRKEFYEDVVKYFTNTYLKGLTPSPCIMCNKHIKLGILAQKARELGADIIVTGHYADIKVTNHGIELHRAKDLSRDQSYFLFGIDKQTLQMLRCPLADFTKEQTRAIVKEAGLEIYKKSDSQDICFVADGKYAELIKELNPNQEIKCGDIVNLEGKVLGQHKGLIYYTIGQRRGLGIGGGDILYVLKLDAEKNQVIVGSQADLLQTKVRITDVNWLGEEKAQEIELMVKLRSRQKIVPAKVNFIDDNNAELTLLEDFYGVAPGQGCCFYLDNRVLGGGMIV